MRVYNNYDGYMYTVHKLSLKKVRYQGVLYNLDKKNDGLELLEHFVKDGSIIKYVEVGVTSLEYQFRFTRQLIPTKWIEDKVDQRIFQLKPTLLNLSYFLTSELDNLQEHK